MGELKVKKALDSERAKFVSHLLKDLKALEIMQERGLIESSPIRMGAEQEFCLVNLDFSPATRAIEVLEEINDPHFTTELAKFNLEINLDPLEVGEDCFAQTSAQLQALLQKAEKAANRFDTKTILTGILPTITKKELTLDHITPINRYYALNEIMKEARGADFSLHLTGVDELSVLHDSIMFEACNTSFQLHLQIAPEDFVSSYNWAQAISGPMLSVCSNSPLLLGKELWSETRIALFQQSTDTRSTSYSLTDKESRVSFGNGWITNGITDIFKDDISRHRILLHADIEEDSLRLLEEGAIPNLSALRIHNGSIYRWNRPCYGTGGGKAHIRIENRYIPSGPTIEDEIANFALWIGLMLGRPKRFDHIASEMDFLEAKENFVKAARTGKASQMQWLGKATSASELMQKDLLPVAYEGLKRMNVSANDINKYLEIIELRCNRNTGASWMVQGFRNLKKQIKKDDALKALTESIYKNQQANIPVHEWDPITEVPANYPTYSNKYASQIMTQQILTIHQNDLAHLVSQIMRWNNIHHVPVVDSKENLVGIITWKNIQGFDEKGFDELKEVKDIMVSEVITASPSLPVDEVAHIMLTKKIGCLPVVQDKKLVGIVTRNDIVTRHNG